MSDKILFIDTETGGLDPSRHSLLSLALVVWADMEILDSQEILINDGVLSVTKEALAVNKIDLEKHKMEAISRPEAMDQLMRFLGNHFPGKGKITLAGHNVHFDVAFFKVFFSANNKDFSAYFSHRVIDTSSILHYLYLSGKIKQRAISSDAAFALFDIQVEGRHTAMGDAMATAKLFTRLLSLLK
jgi:DNA polymerase-3 subunit epsilon